MNRYRITLRGWRGPVSYRIEPLHTEPDSFLGPCLIARYERWPDVWEEGSFREDLILSMEPEMSLEAA